MFEDLKELKRICRALNAEGRKSLLNVGKGLLCNKHYRKTEDKMTSEQFEYCVDKVLEMCEKI